MTVSFDVNYRPKLWTPEVCRQGCDAYATTAALFLLPVRDAQLIYGIDPGVAPEEALAQFQAWYPQATVILTLGAEGAIAAQPGGQPFRQAVFPAGIVGRIGGGDASNAGVFYCYLRRARLDNWLADALHWGAAAAALKYTSSGDMGLFEKEEVKALMRSAGDAVQVQR